ncbi:MAG: hypothetical protein IJE48_05565 [Clostridia bacterium]|nr:hypothetical protein [Clostridia bacterium]
MNNNHNFDINSFISPDISHSPVYVWVWNDRCSRDIIDTQLAEMQTLGIRAFYILPEPQNFRPDSMPTPLAPDYLSEAFFELCAYAAEKAEKLGMICWIYDEGGWPSGGACGKVIKDHPEYAQEEIKTHKRFFRAGDVYKKTTPDVLAAFLNESIFIEEGYEFTSDSVVTEYVTEKEIAEDKGYPDLFNKAATEYFLEITHKKYAASMKNLLGKSVTAVFTDEPKAPSSAFSTKLAEKYEAAYGESVLPYLPLISDNTDVTDKNVHILHRWYDLCSRTFCENYLLTCKEWANRHGTAFTGHMDKDHNPLGCMQGGGNFNLMRSLRCFDIPGVDVIWRQLYPENKIAEKNDYNAYNGFFPRYASSAAAQNGSKLAMSEIFGVAGAAISYDLMRYTVGYQAVRGINIFNLFNFPLGRKGALLAQELPVFTESQPYYRFLGQFNSYTERLSYLSTLGERVYETGLYYPAPDFQGGLRAEATAKEFDSLGRKLEDLNVDFDIVDNDVIQSADGADEGCLRIGIAAYKNIIIPEGAFVLEESQAVLNRFIRGGGRVSHNPCELNPVIRIEGCGLRAMHRKVGNAELFILFREYGENGNYRIHLPSSDGYLLDLINDALTRFESKEKLLELTLAIGETAVILLTDENFVAADENEFLDKFCITDGFLFRKELELTCGENGFECIEHPKNAVPVILGDWSYLIGKAYSGSCIYETVFSLPPEKSGRKGRIELGEVHHAAQVFINGHCLGAALMSPFRLNIPAGILKENNKLKIVVINTSANWYVHTDYFDRWSISKLSPYFEPEIEFAKDFVSGGLYGPVTLYTE